MENKETNIDDLFRDGLGDYAETPPPAAWERLEQTLKSNRAAKPGWPNRKFGYMAIVALLLLLSATVVRNIAGTSVRKDQLTQNEAAFTNAPKVNEGNAVNGTTAAAATGAETTAGNNNSNNNNNTTTDKQDNNNNPINNDKAQATNTDNTATNQKTGAALKRQPAKNGPLSATKKKNSSKKSGNKNGNTDERDDNEDVYNSSKANTGVKNAPIVQAQEPATKDKPKEVALAAKPAPAKPLPIAANKPAAKQKVREHFNMFDVGVKAGYETGFNNDAAKKAVISPYLQFNISPRLAVMLQPAIKYASLAGRRIGTAQGYYKVNNDGKITQLDSELIPVIYEGQIVDTLWQRNYSYKQTHDSIVKINGIGGSYTEFELPILLKYNINKKFSVYGGVNIVYSKQIVVKESTITTANIARNSSQYTIANYHDPAPPTSPLDSVITYTGTPIANYTGPQYATTQSAQVRYGYMLGFTYEYNKRWLFDALVQQTSAAKNVQAGYNVNTTLSAPYVRLMLGYKLTK